MANPTARREHQGSAAVATLTATMGISDTTFSISTNTGWPTGSVGTFFVVVDQGTGSEEKILCLSQSSNVVTVAPGGRGADGTVAATHTGGSALVFPCWTATEADELNLHAASTSAVHGVTGSVVGSSDAQTLTNKTMSGASNTFSAIPEAAVTNLTGDLAARQPLAANLTTLAGLGSVANLSTVAGYGSMTELNGLQALSSSTGLVAQTAAGTFSPRSIASANSKIAVSNADGAAGNPTLTVQEANLTGIPTSSVAWTSPAPVVYTASGSFTSGQAGTARYLRIRCVNGGGGGGGVAGVTSGTNSAVSGAGAGGAYAEKLIATSGLTFPLQVTVGAAGAAGTAGANQGGAGGQSKVVDNNGTGSTLCTPGVQTANQGGAGGAAGTAIIGNAGVAGYDPSTSSAVGDVIVWGQPGGNGTRIFASVCIGAAGGNSGCGYGAGGAAGSATGAGAVGQNYGGGGSSTINNSNASAVAGFAGAAGIVLIEPVY